MPQDMPGFMWGVVVDNKDPKGAGRVKIRIPGIWDEPHHPDWVIPLGWPGAGHPSRGSRYMQPIDSQVAVIFEHGNIDATPAYLPAMYGASAGIPDGPELATAMFQEGGKESVLDAQILWEDDILRCYIMTEDTGGEPNDRRFVVIDKRSGTHIELNATDGAQKKSGTITLHATTSIDIKSYGTVNIEGAQVLIQGRPVAIKPSGTI